MKLSLKFELRRAYCTLQPSVQVGIQADFPLIKNIIFESRNCLPWNWQLAVLIFIDFSECAMCGGVELALFVYVL